MDILIIDDEGNLRRMLRSLLEGEGFTVREAELRRSGNRGSRQRGHPRSSSWTSCSRACRDWRPFLESGTWPPESLW